GVRRIQAELVQHHLAVLGPHPPGFLRHVVIDLLTQLGVEWRLIEPGHLFLKLHAKNSVACGHWVTRHTRLLKSSLMITTIIRDRVHPIRCAECRCVATSGHVYSVAL